MSINLVQNFDVEVDSRELLKKYLSLAMETILESNQEITVKVVDRQDTTGLLPLLNTSKKLPLFLIGGWYADTEGNHYVSGGQKLKAVGEKSSIEVAIDFMIDAIKIDGKKLGKEFIEKCGDGYDASFNEYDGTVEIGYRIMSLNTFPAVLAVSLVHIYYGK